MPDLKTIFIELNYDARWLDYGLLSEEFWQNQYSIYLASDDKNTEHYRYGAFQTVLRNHEVLDEVALNHYIELALADTDRTMGDAALGQLLQWPRLSDEQLRQLSSHPAYNLPFLRKLHQRVFLLRELNANGITDALFQRFLDSQDADIQRVLLLEAGIKAEHLKLLQTEGASKAVRNIAKQKLQRIAAG